jgi:NADH-quinone oxidoreductase subunit D
LRVGGLAFDVTDQFVQQMRDFIKGYSKAYGDVVRLLNRNRIFIDRTQGIGVLSRDEAINRSATGPIARASGVLRDLRKDEPYLAYKDFDFKVICAQAGDCYARYLVRMEETLESTKIIQQAIENLPGGSVNAVAEGEGDGKAVLPDQLAIYRSIESLIQHFELIMLNRRWETPVDEVYGATESPNGELGFYVVADGTGVPYRARTRPPSYIHFAMFPSLIVGHQLSDVVAVLGSLNIIAAELDR